MIAVLATISLMDSLAARSSPDLLANSLQNGVHHRKMGQTLFEKALEARDSRIAN